MTPRQLALAYLLSCATSLVVAIFFALRGAWYVLMFAVFEMSALGWAFVQFGRHASDRERIVLMDNCLLIELVQGESITQFRLDPRAARVAPPATPGGLVELEANGTKIEIGRFLTGWKRREFARELRSALAS